MVELANVVETKNSGSAVAFGIEYPFILMDYSTENYYYLADVIFMFFTVAQRRHTDGFSKKPGKIILVVES
jgi:hypothetical protein